MRVTAAGRKPAAFLILSGAGAYRFARSITTVHYWEGSGVNKIVFCGRNDSGKSTVLGELYNRLKQRGYQPLAIGSGVQDEKPYLFKGIDPVYVTIAVPDPGSDVAEDIERAIRSSIAHIKERNQLILHARKALDELNKVRSILELGSISAKDIPSVAAMPDVVLIEAVGINDGYRAQESRQMADILVSVVPAGLKSEILMEPGNVLLEEADIVVVTKIDITPRSEAATTVKFLQRFYRYKPVIPVVATQGVHMDLVLDEIIKHFSEPLLLLDGAEALK
jgi:predicted GTPase